MAWTLMRKYCMRKKKKELETKSLVDLPRDIFIDILMRLPLKTLGCLRCVSKSLLKKLDDPLINATIHTPLLTASEVPPQLMSVTRIELLGRVKMQPMKYDGKALTADQTKRVSLIFPPTKPTLVKYHFDFCYYNLFFFKEASREHPCFLFDPLRGEVLKLPTNSVPVRENFHRSYGMGFDTITKTHKIVCVSSNFEEDCLGVQFLVLGTSSWKEIPSLPPCYPGEEKVCAYGDMHWLIHLSTQERDYTKGKQIISFDLKKEEFHRTPLPDFKKTYNLADVDVDVCIHLLTWRGSIAISYASDMSIEIWVLKNYDTKEWVQELDTSIPWFLSRPEYEFWPGLTRYSLTCCEWEHGIFFMDKFGEQSFFMDLSLRDSKEIRVRSISTGGYPLKPVKIVSYAGSFISLKDYGQLVKLEEEEEEEEEEEAEKYRMQPSFLQKLRQCFVGSKKIKRGKQQLWRLG